MSSKLLPSENPKKWRFTWESQSHTPTLRLFLFNPNTKPSTQCTDLKINLILEQSQLLVAWFEDEVEVSLRIPIPRVLVDVESSVNFRAFDDHIEVKLVLLLPVDHPIVSEFDSVLNLSEEDEFGSGNVFSDELKPLLMDSDLKNLSSSEGVHFYCRSCSTKLTRTLSFFEEMPSVNWREVADNWFGACCCSFGGISEKLVTRYAKSHTRASGVCLLNSTSVVLCKDDLVRYKFPYGDGCEDNKSELDFAGDNCSSKAMRDNGSKQGRAPFFDSQSKRCCDLDGNISCVCLGEDNVTSKLEREVIEEVTNSFSSSRMSPTLEVTKNVASAPGCSVDTKNHVWDHDIECCTLDSSEPSPKEQKPGTIELLANQKSFLNGFLGNVFMARSSNLSKDVQWVEFLCPQCSCLLGAYPRGNTVDLPVDSGVQLFKCYISTSLLVRGSSDLFRKYTLERMFTNQLLESAKDELSFRTVVRDLQTKRPMLQIVLLNPNSWCCTGYCLGTMEPIAKIDMYPTIKVLFSNCSNSTEFQLRIIEEWVTKNQADEVYMLTYQIKELIESLDSANNILQPSHSFLHGLSLSSMRR